ncbi:FkbM family methyltransferase [Sphingomonas sp. HITSZ_GF]|uniref:FkbM family methyltransferase n=1 Tax=Sphingomonas sp. HITSZ_GF TaxID=3037247 RepID=UPI00240E587A|nr:FkbM family methyltransferase [Sphingomonas sp. HITSZ_GF]MDG2535774.1 FkbM family methyltransferase [Sphingomonas sp. HITSZ_GF]
MSIARKAAKVASLLPNARFRSALLGQRVAAAVEHLEAIRFCAPATLLDVGANKGQFATAVRGTLPETQIHAFEPLPMAGERFEAVFKGDGHTQLHKVALGKEAREARFYVADRDDSSSLLKPGAGQAAAFGVSTAREITVSVKPLEAVIDPATLQGPILLKIDVQGAELEVLEGIQSLDRIDFIYVELSFVELYEGQALFEDVRAYLASRGFLLRGVYNQVSTAEFGPTQADCLFVRADREGGAA